MLSSGEKKKTFVGCVKSVKNGHHLSTESSSIDSLVPLIWIISLDLKCVYQFMIIMVHNLFLKLSLFLLDLVPVFLFGCCCWIQIRQVFWLLFISCLLESKIPNKIEIFLKVWKWYFPHACTRNIGPWLFLVHHSCCWTSLLPSQGMDLDLSIIFNFFVFPSF